MLVSHYKFLLFPVSSFRLVRPPPRRFRGFHVFRIVVGSPLIIVWWFLIRRWKLFEMPWHFVALLIALVCLVFLYRLIPGTEFFRTRFASSELPSKRVRRVRYVCNWLQHQGLLGPSHRQGARKYFNTIEMVTIAYGVSIGNTTAILCC